MIYTILVALDADPLPPLADLPGLLILILPGCNRFAWGLLMYEGIIYLSVAERIRSTIHSIHSTLSLIQSTRQGKRGASATYKGAEKGDATESRKLEPQGQITIWIKKLA